MIKYDSAGKKEKLFPANANKNERGGQKSREKF